MNARERAFAIAMKWKRRTVWINDVAADIEKAIIAAEEAKAKEEREAIIKTAEERRNVIQDYMNDLDRNSMNYKIATIQISELDHMISMIRARSEDKQQQQKGD